MPVGWGSTELDARNIQHRRLWDSCGPQKGNATMKEAAYVFLTLRWMQEALLWHSRRRPYDVLRR